MTDSNLRPNLNFCNWCSNPILNQKRTGATRRFCTFECTKKFHSAINNINKYSWPSCVNDGCKNRRRSKTASHCNACYRVIRDKRAGICTVHKCDKPAVRVGHGLCENHYYRIRKNGSPDLTPRVERQISNGYVMIRAEGHPLASKSDGWAFEHRIVVYEKFGPGEHKCHWCPKRLEWNKIVIDHLNEKKTDNRIENLVISCSPCNRMRGAIIPFIRGMSEESLSHLIETFGFMRSPDLDYKPFKRNPDRKRRKSRKSGSLRCEEV